MLASPPVAAPVLSCVEVFKTNLTSAARAAAVARALHAHFQGQLLRVSFDLQDRDRVLRVQASAAAGPDLWEPLMQLVRGRGVKIELLPD